MRGFAIGTRQHTIFRMPNTIFRMPNTIFRMPNTIFRMPNTIFRMRRVPAILFLLHSIEAGGRSCGIGIK